MPQGGVYIQCDECDVTTISLNLPWPYTGKLLRHASEQGWLIERDPVRHVCPTCQQDTADESPAQVHNQPDGQDEPTRT